MKSLLLALLLPSLAHAYYPQEFSKPLTRIAFGSCNKQTRPQTIWPAVSSTRPDLWIWMGDNVYADTDDARKIEATYARLLAAPLYASFRARTPIVGTWDDHDYGRNDAGKEYALKDESQKLLLNFLEEPHDSPRWRQRGVYTSYAFGPRGRKVEIFMLDLRYFRDEPGRKADMLGPEQWAWLERALKSSDAELKLIVSSTQLVINVPFGEEWRQYPRSRERLYRLIRSNHIDGVIVLSGDKHLGVIDHASSRRVGYPLYDVTASGLTHHVEGVTQAYARLIYGPRVYTGFNFGTLEIDWNHAPVRVRLGIRDSSGRLVRAKIVSLDRLRAR